MAKSHRVIDARGNGIAITGCIRCRIRGYARDHSPICRHTADSNVIRGAIIRRNFRNNRCRRSGGAAQAYITGAAAETGHRFSKHRREVDRAGGSWVGLAGCLVNADVRRRGVNNPGVAGRSMVNIEGRIFCPHLEGVRTVQQGCCGKRTCTGTEPSAIDVTLEGKAIGWRKVICSAECK